MSLTPGKAYHLQCLGPIPGPKWLDGRTADGTVGLAPQTEGVFTGTKWRVFDGGGAVVLQCLGTIPGNRYLDGRTGNGTVGLAPITAEPYTGTRWKVSDGGEGAIRLECQGTIPGPRWLNGITGSGTVALDSNSALSGTRWSAEEVSFFPLFASRQQGDLTFTVKVSSTGIIETSAFIGFKKQSGTYKGYYWLGLTDANDETVWKMDSPVEITLGAAVDSLLRPSFVSRTANNTFNVSPAVIASAASIYIYMEETEGGGSLLDQINALGRDYQQLKDNPAVKDLVSLITLAAS